MQRLFTVTGVVQIRGHGVVLAPWIPLADLPCSTRESVELRFADGSRRVVDAFFDIPRTPHMYPANLRVACMVAALTEVDVPVGTEVWVDPSTTALAQRTCDECASRYRTQASKMAALCPECAHWIYGNDNCEHDMRDGRCTRCDWDGSVSQYVAKLRGDRP